MSAALVLKPGTLVFGNNPITSNSAQNKGLGDHLYTRETFEPLVGGTFQVLVGKKTVALRLMALTNEQPKSGPRTGKIACTDCFSLRFHALQPLPAPATVHTLNHSQLGNFELFMVQSKDGANFSQTAIVNHLSS